jgi:UDP-glucose 4-epimerase
MRALVTGGAGFIGSHLVPYLMKQGCDVSVLDNLSEGQRDWIPSSSNFIEGDITNPDVCRAACHNQDYVFHLAAMSRVGSSLDRLEYCTQQNVMGTLYMLQASKEAGVKKFLYPGSSSYYGNQAPPHHEGLLPECLNPYALTKYVGELYCKLFNDVYDLPTLTLRLFNVYGARQPKTGDDALVVGAFFHRRKSGDSLTIHGDGSNERDFIYVKDVAAAFWSAAQSDLRGEVLNVGSGKTTSILDLAKMVDENIKFGPPRPGDAKATLADIKKLTGLLGMIPNTPLQEGLKETWDEDYGG